MDFVVGDRDIGEIKSSSEPRPDPRDPTSGTDIGEIKPPGLRGFDFADVPARGKGAQPPTLPDADAETFTDTFTLAWMRVDALAAAAI